ncbi:terminase gpA endonuclease subunit [Desulfobulbus oligotrophicus]|uniref:Phage terminase large subunit family protein n=1 Tax=Desulfobulbus oligotrophicus TaxID=1909699 RepID=A0A7T6AR28_9BACT|nr:terminase gpA endonuclease subunit [Desulfobulbus oligotrophicus]QQG66351.1 phage terminase large subunit family protein [Desulfobulbus oligotrophicus]
MPAAVTTPQQTRLVPRTIPLPSFLPARVRRMLSGRTVGSDRQPVITLPEQVRRVLRQPEKISVADHALKYRVVTDGAHEGSWRHEYAPHTVKIMNTFGESWVREIWFCAVEQSGKTNTMLNCMQWAIDCAPGNVFYLMPSEDASKKIVGKKIKPMLVKSPKLKKLVSTRQDDTTMTCISLRNGVEIFPAHANSATSMATWSAKYCFGDEVDKYPLLTGKETDPITLIKKRNRIYRGRYKRFFASTAAEKFIYTAGVLKCHQIWEWRLRCPDCGQLVKMDAEHLALAEGATPESVELNGCDYVCNACASVWDEGKRRAAIKAGCWVAVKGADAVRPSKVGFHHRSWECLDISLREIAVAYLKSKTGALADKLDWAHGHEAVDYVHEQQDRKEDYILRLVDPDQPRGVVPADTACVLLLVDTQQRGFFYQVWACGWGPEVKTAMIDYGYVDRWQHLIDLGRREWTDAEGKQFRVRRGYIDSGGGTDPHNRKHSRTSAVYEFCRRNRLFRPIKGNSRQDELFVPKKIDFYPTRTGKKVPMVNGPIRYNLQVNHFKDELADKLMIEPGSPGGITLHAGVGNDYAAQMCAEYADERGNWHCPRGKANHHWDIGVYLRGAITVEGLYNKRRPRPQRDAAAVAIPKKSFVRGWK